MKEKENIIRLACAAATLSMPEAESDFLDLFIEKMHKKNSNKDKASLSIKDVNAIMDKVQMMEGNLDMTTVKIIAQTSKPQDAGKI